MPANNNDSSKTLYIIDGHAQIFRAYYAIRGGMTSPVTGEPTQAVFGFAGMMLKLFRQFHPHYVVVAIDSPGKTFRDEMFAEYKATREPPPEDFHEQEQRIFQMIKLFGVPLLGQVGVEADDIIATLCKRVIAENQGVKVRVVSKDKDLEQLLCDRISMFDIHKDESITVDSLKETKGISPEQVADVLALMGDKVDNIPGVDGVGPKTAAKLIHEHGSIDGIFENIDKIKGKRKENLLAAQEHLPLSRRLVALKEDVDIPFSMDDAAVSALDGAALMHLFRELGFNRHLDDLKKLLEQAGQMPDPDTLAGAAAADDPDAMPTSLFGEIDMVSDARKGLGEGISTAQDNNYQGVCTKAELDDMLGQLRKAEMVCIDTETIGLGHWSEICGLCFAIEKGTGWYVPMCSPDPSCHLDSETVLAALKPLLEDPKVLKCGHNIKYDMLVLRHAGIEVQGVAFDTMVAAYLLGMPGQKLDDLALKVLRHETIRITELIGEKARGKTQKTMDQVALDKLIPYAAEDADITLQLYHDFLPKLEALDMADLAANLEMPLVSVLADMEYHGIRVDPEVLDEQRNELAKKIDALRTAILDAAAVDFNLDSPKQLSDVLFNQLGFTPQKRTKTGPSTDSEVLEKLADKEDPADPVSQIPRLLLEYRQFSKLVNTYLVALKECIRNETCRVHTSFQQTQTATGRLSSNNPNLQNIPIRTEVGRQIRRAFIADEGQQLIAADYSQIELRMLAHLSKDEALIEAFNSGEDIHSAVASQVFGIDPDDVTPEQRVHAKTINFGIIYGVTPYGLARRIEGLDFEGAKELIDSYKARFKGIDRFLAECVEFAKEKGYVKTMLGRRREITQLDSRNPQTRSLGERLAINTAVQGSAADLIKLAMVNLHRRIASEDLPMKLLLQIHDELVLETPQDKAEAMAEIVVGEMTGAMELVVPLKVDHAIGENWLEAK